MRRSRFQTSLLVCLLAVASFHGLAAQQGRGWKAHDTQRPKPRKVTPGESVGLPPSDAIVLFGGTSLDGWVSRDGSPARWVVRDGYMETAPGAGPIMTRRGFGDSQLHVEWASPAAATGSGQNRGNSGVYFMGKYEVQVLDSYTNETYADGQAAALYGQHPPLVNASRPSGAWQSYDVIFHQPRFGAKGLVLSPARLTVFHNGVLVQDNAELFGPTNWLKYDPYTPHARELPLMLQDHDHPVRFRNIWLRPLPDAPMDEKGLAESRPALRVPASTLQEYVGSYGTTGSVLATVTRRSNQLFIDLFGRGVPLELVPESTTRFAFRHTAGTAEFVRQPGQPVRLKLSVAENVRDEPRIP